MGSTLVIPRVYATIEPTPLPLPGPVIIPFCVANLIKSQTIKK